MRTTGSKSKAWIESVDAERETSSQGSVRYQQSETTAVLDGKGLGSGTLYVAENRLSWFDGTGMGFAGIPFHQLACHLSGRDAYPQEHLYVMVNAKLSEEGGAAEESEMKEKDSEGEQDESDEDTDPITEIRFVPSDKAALEPMFSAMCECQALHPDPEDDDSDSDFEGDEYDVEEAEQGQGGVPSFCTYEEGLSSHLRRAEHSGRLEGMLAESVAQQYHMAGVRTESAAADFEDGMEVDTGSAVAGQFEDADVEHW
ncbi:methylosome subunit pICln-like isoform X1 [Acipenser oxyrinchus oxyrinchus]|uniref:Methylosome subunit pICln n=1 Tax=Acipenser oxyrinchus oxyrinchus TaxID=40147 RepID=A0AAD8CHI4_ACIOX|nr:methylosome subunit pICln-like isoform X1 [Acipenser oxyrinchus oxyrinchus]